MVKFTDPSTLYGFITETPLAMFLASARAGTVVTLVPFFGGNGMVRQAFIMLTIGVIVPMLVPTLPPGMMPLTYLAALIFKEMFIGLLLGYFISIIFWGIEMSGELLDLQRGTTAGSVYNPTLGAQESPLGGLFLRIISYVFFATGGFMTFLGVLFASYQAYPIAELSPAFLDGWQKAAIPFVSQIFQLGMLYALPVLIIFFFLDFGLGLMNRFVPQLNVFFLSLPLKSGLCFLFLLFYLNYLVEGFKYDMFTEAGAAVFLKKIFQ